jgi:hypothetical protein
MEKIKETIKREKNDLEKSSAHHSASLHLMELCQDRKSGTVEDERPSPRNYPCPMLEAGLGNSQTLLANFQDSQIGSQVAARHLK